MHALCGYRGPITGEAPLAVHVENGGVKRRGGEVILEPHLSRGERRGSGE